MIKDKTELMSVDLGVQELSNYATSWCLSFILFLDMLL